MCRSMVKRKTIKSNFFNFNVSKTHVCLFTNKLKTISISSSVLLESSSIDRSIGLTVIVDSELTTKAGHIGSRSDMSIRYGICEVR